VITPVTPTLATSLAADNTTAPATARSRSKNHGRRGLSHDVGQSLARGADGIALAAMTYMAKSKRSSGKRELLKSRSATFFAKRTGKGRFKEMDERGRASTADRRRKAKTKVKRGYGDRGDRAA
jgi:hypothetical protein